MSNIIHEMRKKAGLKQGDMAKQLGISSAALCGYEKNFRLPKIHIAYRIIDLAKVYGIILTLEDIYSSRKNK